MHLKPQESSLHSWPGHSWQGRRCRPNAGQPTCLRNFVLLFLDPQWFPEKWACITVNRRSLIGYCQRTVKIITNQTAIFQNKTNISISNAIWKQFEERKRKPLKSWRSTWALSPVFFFYAAQGWYHTPNYLHIIIVTSWCVTNFYTIKWKCSRCPIFEFIYYLYL